MSSRSNIAFKAAADPLLIGFDLPLRCTYYPIGFPLVIETNSPEVLRAAEESWSDCAPAFQGTDPVRVRVGVRQEEAPDSLAIPAYRAQGSLLSVVASQANCGACDLDRAFGFLWVTPTTAADRAHFRYYFLEGVVYSILEHLHLAGLHAACVALEGSGVLLLGPPGAGKSCLAFACARRGWTYVADDSVALLRRRKDRKVVGKPHHLRFHETAAELFPELRRGKPFMRPNGERSIEIRSADFPHITTALCTVADHIVFLDRQASGPARLQPISKEDTLEQLRAAVFTWEARVYEEKLAAVQTLREASSHILHYADLDQAVEALESLVHGGVK